MYSFQNFSQPASLEAEQSCIWKSAAQETNVLANDLASFYLGCISNEGYIYDWDKSTTITQVNLLPETNKTETAKHNPVKKDKNETAEVT